MVDWGKTVDQVVDATRCYVERATAALGRRVAALEAFAQKNENVDHRVERHAQHIARLETRLAKLEREVGDK